MAIKKGLSLGSVLNKSGKFGRIGARISKHFFAPELGGGAAIPLKHIQGTDETIHTQSGVGNFKNQMLAEFARPSLFRVDIPAPPGMETPAGATREVQRIMSASCYNAQIPGISLATTDKDLGYRSVAYQKLYDDVLLSFYCREDFPELDFMQQWMNLISNSVTNRFEYYEKYVADIDIITIARRNGKTLRTTLWEAYPKKIDPMQLDYGSNDIMRMTVSFTYRYFTQVWGDVEKKGTFIPRPPGTAMGGMDKQEWDEYGDRIN